MITGALSSFAIVEALAVLQRIVVSPTQLAVLVLMGSLFGLLYAASQMRAPWRGLLAVAVFYGFILWLLSGPVLGRFIPENLSGIVHSSRWLLACIAYGLSLALVTGVYQRTHSRPSAQVPRD